MFWSESRGGVDVIGVGLLFIEWVGECALFDVISGDCVLLRGKGAEYI